MGAGRAAAQPQGSASGPGRAHPEDDAGTVSRWEEKARGPQREPDSDRSEGPGRGPSTRWGPAHRGHEAAKAQLQGGRAPGPTAGTMLVATHPASPPGPAQKWPPGQGLRSQ